MRDDFTPRIVEILAKRVGNRCSNPGCRQLTSGPQVDPTKAINIGVAAHITAASSGGPRYDPSLTEEQRRSPTNGIWLCQKCAKLVDNDELRYSKERLYEWKHLAEDKALKEIENALSSAITASRNERSGLSMTFEDISETVSRRLALISRLSLSVDREAELKRLIALCLEGKRPDIAADLIPKLTLSSNKDEMYWGLFHYHLKSRDTVEAQSVVSKLSLSTDRDRALRLLLGTED